VPQRQQDRSKATRATLIATARRLFAEHGYAAVPAGEIVAEAGLTRGALYHHFQDKQGLFQAVFMELEAEVEAEIKAAMAAAREPAVAALGTFLAICERPEMIQIGLTDAPAVLGWQTWRQIEAQHGLGLITGFLRQASEQGALVTDAVDVLAKLMLSALIEAALVIANAADRSSARQQAQEALLALFAGLADRQSHQSLLAMFGTSTMSTTDSVPGATGSASTTTDAGHG
jgi:AcrR family transcriptional regulator